VRGLHVQVAPHLESKSIWCSSGELFDVIVDTRPEHGSFGHWAGVLLDGTRPQLLRIPPGVAHGYQTLAVNTAINYLIDGTYAPESARTNRWDDPTLGIDWPHEVTLISDADRAGQPWPAS
jgi:dTDP-4-dehydrorhamnose 3,5-epimerase